MQKVNIIWFRRDLRLEDNTALYHALRSDVPVLPIFIFDKNILDKLEDKLDRRVHFIHCVLNEMQEKLLKVGSSLEVTGPIVIDSLQKKPSPPTEKKPKPNFAEKTSAPT